MGTSAPRSGRHALGGGTRPACHDQRYPWRTLVPPAVRVFDPPGPEPDLAVVVLGRLPRPYPPAAAPGGGRPPRQGHGIRPRPERHAPAEAALRRSPRRLAR